MRVCVKKTVLCLVATAVLGSLAVAEDPAYLSPVALVTSADGTNLYVAEVTAKQVASYRIADGTSTAVPLPEEPSGLALSPDGSALYVSAGGASGQVYTVDLLFGAVTSSLPAGHTPVAPVPSPDGKTLYVCKRFNNAIGVIDLESKTAVADIPVLREPVAAALTPDGKWLCVANHLPAGASDGAYTAAVVSIIDTSGLSVAANVALPNGSTGLRGLCLSPDGRYAYVVHILGRYQLPTTQLERGWMNTNALSIIDVAEKTLVNTVLLDSVDLGAANPWGVLCAADGAYLCVSHAGTHEVSVIDRPALHDKLSRIAAGEAVSQVSRTAEDVPNDLSFLVNLRRRIKLPGNGPRGIAMLGTHLYAAQYFSGNLAVVDIDPAVRPRPQSLSLGEQPERTLARRGEMLFNDADMCFQQWQSCASCHPDARADGLNWDLLNDGMGNPKNTKSMLLSHATPPVMISGVRDKAETAVRAGIKYIQFAVRPEEDAVAIDQYLKALQPTPSPFANLDPPAIARGKALFDRARCHTCHSGPYHTDLQQYRVGTGKDRQADWEFDTPMLTELWRTAPYLHDGRAATIEAVLTAGNIDDQHGKTSDLTQAEIADLAAFLRSL